MSLALAFKSLRQALTELTETVLVLQVTIAEDKPTTGVTVLVDKLDNLVTDLLGALEEADLLATQVLQGAKTSGQLEQDRQALNTIHGLINSFSKQFLTEVYAHDFIEKLLIMGRERGREWREWSYEAKTAIERCRNPSIRASEALLECWDELTQRMAHGSVNIQSSNIGHQVNFREDKFEKIEAIG